jgi:pantoate--beta-alanine ligase
MKKLTSIEVDGKRVNGLFLPAVTDLYPDGIEQDVSKQKGTFVDVKGYSQEVSRSGFPSGLGSSPC